MNSLSISSLMAVAITCLVMHACSSAESSSPLPTAHAPIPVTLLPLHQEKVQEPIIASGQFTTDDETILSFKTGGIIQQVLVNEGDFVRKGQLLARLDLTEVNAQLSQAELAFEKAARDFERTRNLYHDSVATLEQFQDARTARSLAEQQLTTARFNQGFSEIRAVADGYVLKKYVNAGQLVSPGTEILRTNGAGQSLWTFRAAVSDKEWSRVKAGDSAMIVTDAAAGKSIPARIARKSEGADLLTGAFGLELKVEEKGDQQLASGLFGTATIIPSSTSTLWSIPHEALLDGNGNKGWVFITENRKTAHKVPVTIASVGRDRVYISNGLEGARFLITEGSAYLSDSSSIQPSKP